MVLRILALLCLLSCQSSQLSTQPGLRSVHAGFVPARTVVLNCLHWPLEATKLASTPVAGSPIQEKSLCEAVDGFVLQGFKDQPYMRGFSPKRLEQMIKVPNFLQQLTSHWRHRAEDCQQCTTPGAFYLESIRPRDSWLSWLRELSAQTERADAALLPIVTYHQFETYDDRGRPTHEERAHLSFLLIELDYGDLIWSGQRGALTRSWRDPPSRDEMFKELQNRLLVIDLWRNFPGRIVFN